MEKLFFVQLGMGVDLHGQDVNVAAVGAIENAIHHNSMPGLRSVLPGNSLENMRVHVRLAVPCDKEKIDEEKIRKVLPFGKVTIEIADGGMLTTSGVVLPEKGDRNDLIYVVNAAVEVGY
ncbi:conserved hypothetical protein [[Clostridium] ultunense Esp]|nr:conserved hypothetical protein [[Clostridium] ultunense Esp]